LVKEEVLSELPMLDFQTVLFLTIAAFLVELVGVSLGMGYGTLLAPLLIIFGYPVHYIVPSILFSQLASGLLASGAHHKFGNVNFGRNSDDLKIVAMLAPLGVLGSIISVFTAVNMPPILVKTYISLLVICMGVLVLATFKRRLKFSLFRLVMFGFIAAFNKGLTGGGYGPLLMTGQVISGVNVKNAVGITLLTEVFICIASIATYIVLLKALDFSLLAGLTLGALLAAIPAAFFVKRVHEEKLKMLVGMTLIILGAFTITKILLF